MNKPGELNLLIVEDDFENQKLLEVFLKRYFKIYVCDNVNDCYKVIADKNIDLFLVDISLRGDKDGLQFVSELRKNEKYKDVPIICISAHVFPQDRQNAFDAGVDEFLARPIFNKDLLNSIKKVFKNKTGIDLD